MPECSFLLRSTNGGRALRYFFYVTDGNSVLKDEEDAAGNLDGRT